MSAKPAFMDEYDRLEAELERLYQIYVEKYRNMDYLEHQLDDYNHIEEDKLKNAQRVLEGIQNTIREE
jgi:clusterin-associated protein 1